MPSYLMGSSTKNNNYKELGLAMSSGRAINEVGNGSNDTMVRA